MGAKGERAPKTSFFVVLLCVLSQSKRPSNHKGFLLCITQRAFVAPTKPTRASMPSPFWRSMPPATCSSGMMHRFKCCRSPPLVAGSKRVVLLAPFWCARWSAPRNHHHTAASPIHTAPAAPQPLPTFCPGVGRAVSWGVAGVAGVGGKEAQAWSSHFPARGGGPRAAPAARTPPATHTPRRRTSQPRTHTAAHSPRPWVQRSAAVARGRTRKRGWRPLLLHLSLTRLDRCTYPPPLPPTLTTIPHR